MLPSLLASLYFAEIVEWQLQVCAELVLVYMHLGNGQIIHQIQSRQSWTSAQEAGSVERIRQQEMPAPKGTLGNQFWTSKHSCIEETSIA